MSILQNLNKKMLDQNIYDFVQKQLELLSLEREENKSNFFIDLSPANLNYLERIGQALTKLTITNFIHKKAGRYYIDFEKTDGLPLEHGLSKGDLVLCVRYRERRKTTRGVVLEVEESTLSISTNEYYEDLEEEEIFTVVKIDSNFTYRVQKRLFFNKFSLIICIKIQDFKITEIYFFVLEH